MASLDFVYPGRIKKNVLISQKSKRFILNRNQMIPSNHIIFHCVKRWRFSWYSIINHILRMDCRCSAKVDLKKKKTKKEETATLSKSFTLSQRNESAYIFSNELLTNSFTVIDRNDPLKDNATLKKTKKSFHIFIQYHWSFELTL